MPERERFPSETFPAFSPVSVERPAGWSPLITPETPLALVKDVPAGTFRPNVVVDVSRYPVQVTLAEVADQVVEVFESLDSYAEAGREYRTAAGHEAFRIEGSFIDHHGRTLYQAAWLVRLERGPFVEVVQLTGTCAADQASETVPELRTICSSVEFE